MTDIQAWAFLVGCNQYLDYRTIVAPSFMCESKTSSLLAKAAGGDLTEIGTAYYREIHNSKVGDLTLVFRVLEATSENTGIEGQGVLKDSFGREIDLIEGIVFKGLLEVVAVAEEELEVIHEKLIYCYREFWNCMSPQPPVSLTALTRPIVNNVEDELKNLKLIRLKPYIEKKEPSSIDDKFTARKNTKWISLSTEEFPDEINSLAVSKDGSYIAIRYARTILVRNWNNKQTNIIKSERILFGFDNTPIAISNNNQLIATAMVEGMDQNVVKVWNVKTGEERIIGEHFFNGFHRVKAVEFTPDSNIVASGGGDKNIKLWDVKSEGLELGTLIGHESEVRCIAISPDGKTLASGDGHGCIKLWDLITRNNTRTITRKKYYEKPVNSLAFSPDSKFIVSGSDECDVTLLDGKTGKKILEFGEHSEPVNLVIFSPNGQMIASASDDCTIKLWDVQEKTEIAVLKGHTKAVTSVSFSPDGRTLVSGSKDKTIRLWERSSV